MRAGEDGCVRNIAEDAARQVKKQEPPATTGVFHTPAEHPQGPHVAGQVPEIAVQEHGREAGQRAAAFPGEDQAGSRAEQVKNDPQEIYLLTRSCEVE
jgi:hypothetical protein